MCVGLMISWVGQSFPQLYPQDLAIWSNVFTVANYEHVDILKQGFLVWNNWRKENPDIIPNLENIMLRGVNLVGNYLENTNLKGADLQDANLNGGLLRGVNFNQANLNGTNLTNADLTDVNLGNATLKKTNLKGAQIGKTVFFQVNLSKTIGLSECKFFGPSIIDNQTLQQSDKLPEFFLEGIGLTDWEIEQTKLYQKDLDPVLGSDILYKVHELRFGSPLQFHNLFITYAHLDYEFVNIFESSLKRKSIRYWRDTKDLPDAAAGPLGKVILKEMKGCIVLLILSKESVSRPWVRFEMENAAKMEVEEGREVLLPIALDDAWKTYNWPIELEDRIKRYNIIDFSSWQDNTTYNQRLEQVFKGLDLFYKNDV